MVHIVLPKLFIKPAVFNQVVEAVGWINSIVDGISKNKEEKQTDVNEFFKSVLHAILTLTKNFSGEELLKMA